MSGFKPICWNKNTNSVDINHAYSKPTKENLEDWMVYSRKEILGQWMDAYVTCLLDHYLLKCTHTKEELGT